MSGNLSSSAYPTSQLTTPAKATPKPGREDILPTETPYFRLLQQVDLPATAGAVTIAHSWRVFSDYRDSGFGRDDVARSSHNTRVATALVYEMTKGDTYAVLLASFGGSWWRHLLTQGQIVAFCSEHRSSLRHGGQNTFFPFWVEGAAEIFVAVVTTKRGFRLKVRCWPFENHAIWDAGHRPRLVLLK